MSRGNCKFKSMELKGLSKEAYLGTIWSNNNIKTDPFDPTRGLKPTKNEIDRTWMLLYTLPSGMSDETYNHIYRESRKETKAKQNKFAQDIELNPTSDVMEQEFGKVYVSPEEAFGNKSIDIGDTLNKAFDD